MKRIRSNVNRFYHHYAHAAERILLIGVLASVSFFIIIIGFDVPMFIRWIHEALNWVLILIYSVYVLGRLLIVPSIRQHIRVYWFSYLIILLVLIDIGSSYYLDTLRLNQFVLTRSHSVLQNVLVLMIQGVVLLTLFSGQVRSSRFWMTLDITPFRLFALAFAATIAVGTFLLLLPNSTTNGISFLDAIFTATSAVCVTGLIVLDTAADFTFTGQVIILMLMQIGGLGILTITLFFMLIGGHRLSVHQLIVSRELMNFQSIRNPRALFGRIIGVTVAIEAIGAILLFSIWRGSPTQYGHEPWFESIFFAVSAFCNAGFSLYSDSFMTLRGDTASLFVISALIILGSIGMMTILNLIQFGKRRLLRRLPNRFPNSVRFILRTSGILLLIGTISFLLLVPDIRFIDAFFQSVTLRTAGFNSVDIGAFNLAAVVICVVLMWIGGASGSTAGGVKLNTVFVFFQGIRRSLLNRHQIIYHQRAISEARFHQSVMIIGLSLAYIVIAFLLFSLVDRHDPVDQLFELVSAFATVGLSRGITADLSVGGKWLIILTMFIGRIGIIAFALSLMDQGESDPSVAYPEEEVQVG